MMAFIRALLLGTVLLFVQSSTNANTIREMFIEKYPADDIEEEVKTAHALVPQEEDTHTSDALDFDLQQSDLSHDEETMASEEREQKDKDMNENEVGRWWGNKMIAFSAYLSADVTLGKEQHVKFDKVLLNDGNGYEASTGIFRAPVSGVYSFTFVVAQRHSYEIRLNLVVDGKVVVGAIAEGTKKYHDVQGTNTVNIHVCKGKPVWVQSYSQGRIEGNDEKYRYTSFSGHILYERK